MNARRLAATETNIAYRTSDYLRWQQQDFVVGIRIVLSDNHTCLGRDGKPQVFTDICDELSAPLGFTNTSGRGCYPKDFKFTGWHPHCRCHAESILKTPEEMAADNQRILDGEQVSETSVNTVDDVPKEFSDWVRRNESRITGAAKEPYFISDNRQRVTDILNAKEDVSIFTPEIEANNKELSSLLSVNQGDIMNFEEADGKKPNPNYDLKDAFNLGYQTNCQMCTVAYEMRRRGFDVEAAPSSPCDKDKNHFWKWAKRNGISINNMFLKSDGTNASYNWPGVEIKENTNAAKVAYIEKATVDRGRYEIYCQWTVNDGSKILGAHVFCLERKTDGTLLWYDPQTGTVGGAEDFNAELKLMWRYAIGIRRTDDNLINPKLAKWLLKRRG